MAYIAFASAKGSPGVTTVVAALAASWPVERSLVVAEVDPAGGDLVVRLDLASEPGLVSLAAAGRRELSAETLRSHTQPLPALTGDGAGRRVLVAPVSAEQATASLSALRGGLARALDQVDADVLVDCGRLDPGSAAHDLATEADLLVMVARPVVAEVHHLVSRLAATKHPAVSLLLVGERPYSVSEVAETVGATPLGTVAVDTRAATVLAEGGPGAVRLLRRSRLMRDARALAEGLADWLGTRPGTGSPVPAAAPTSPPVAAPPAMVPPVVAPAANEPPVPVPPPSAGGQPGPAVPGRRLPPPPPPGAPRPPTFTRDLPDREGYQGSAALSTDLPVGARPSTLPPSPPPTVPPGPPPTVPADPSFAEPSSYEQPPFYGESSNDEPSYGEPPSHDDERGSRGPVSLRSAVAGLRGEGRPPKHFRRSGTEEPRR